MDYNNPRLAEIYDLDNPWAADTDFYLSLAPPLPADILDLGCGTGTLCCAFAERGHRATGVDPSAAMLAVAARKPHASEVELVQATAQRYQSNRRFDLIVMSGHAFQVLLTDADTLAALNTMRRHLNVRGLAAFETRNPRLDWAGEWAIEAPTVHPVPGGQLRQSLEVLGQREEFITFSEHFKFPDETVTSTSTLRFPSRAHLEALIAQSGLAVRNLFGDWEASPFDPDRSRDLIFVLEKGH